MSADVAIVGCGPVGATLANILGQADVATVVHERDTRPYPQPRACHLDGEIMRIFQSVGLGEEMDAIVEPSSGMEFVDSSLERIFTYEDFRRDPILGWEEDYVFIQPQLDGVLRRGIERFDSVDLRLGSDVVAGSDLDATYVVACDGARSSLRVAAGVDLIDLGFDEEWLVVDVMLRRPVDLPDVIRQICDPENAATFVPSAGAHRRWEFRLGDQDDRDAAVSPSVVWGRLAPWLEPDDAELVRAAVYQFHAVVADQWRIGDLFLAGDAAHQMPPVHGSGGVLGRP